MKRARSRRRAPAVVSDESDSEGELPSIPKPPAAARAPSTASTSVAKLIVKQAADHKPQPLDLSGIDPSFWAPVDAAAAASTAASTAADTPVLQRPTWLLNVAESTHYQSSYERAVDALESTLSACEVHTDPTLLPPVALQAEPPTVAGSAYVTHLRAVVDHALSSASCAGLLTPEERRLARAFLDLDHPAASLMARLFQRKGPWFRVSALRYAEMTGRRGWWEREEGDAAETVAPLPPPDDGIPGKTASAAAAGQTPSDEANDHAVDSGIQAATTAVAVRALVDAGFLVPLPGAGAPAGATAAGATTASPAPVNAFARLMGGGGARTAQVSACAPPPTPSSASPPSTAPPPEPLLLALEAAHSCCTAPELRAILAQLGGVRAAPRAPAASTAGAGKDEKVVPPTPLPAKGASSAGAPVAPTRGAMLQQLTDRVFTQRTVFGGFLPLPKVLLACLVDVDGGRGRGEISHPSVATPAPKSVGATGGGNSWRRGNSGSPGVAPATKPRHAFGLSSGAKASTADKLAFSSAAGASASPLVRVSRPAYAMLRRAHSLFYLVTATANLSSGQGTGAWAVAGGASALHAGLPPFELAADVFCGEVRSRATSVAARWRAAVSQTASAAPSALSAPATHAADAQAAAAAAGRARGSKWGGGSSGSRYADSAGASDSFIPAGSGVGAGASGLSAGGGGSDSHTDHWQLYRLSSGESWPNSGLYSPALLQTFRKLDFAPYACNGATRLLPSLAHFRLLEAAHLFRAQVDCVGVFGTLLPELPAADALPVIPEATGSVAHLGFGDALADVATSPAPSGTGDCNIAVQTTPPLLAGLQLLPYAALLTGVPLDVWSDALCLSVSVSCAPPATVTLASCVGVPPSAALRCQVDPSTGVEVIELLSSADSDVEAVVAAAEAAAKMSTQSLQQQLPSVLPMETLNRHSSSSEQCAASVYLALSTLPSETDSMAVPSSAAALADDLCGPMPPADLVGAASLRLVLRICAGAALSSLKALTVATPSCASVAAGVSLITDVGPALLAAYRVSLAAALTQLWHATPSGTPGARPLTGHPWIHQLTAPSLFTALIWEAVDPLERSRRYVHTLPFLAQLVTSCARFTPHRSGRWWARLVLNASHVGLQADAVAAGRAGLQRIHVRAGERLALHLRTSRLAKLLDSKMRAKEDAAGSKRDSLKRRRNEGSDAVTHDDGVSEIARSSEFVVRPMDANAPAAMADDPDANDEDARALAILSMQSPLFHAVEPSAATGGTTAVAARDTLFTPEDADMPLLLSLRAVCNTARAARRESAMSPTQPLPPLPVDGFSRRALNRTAGQKSVFVADFDEDNDGDWADVVAAAAAVNPTGANDGEAGDEGADKDTANIAARSRIRLLTVGAAAGAAEPPSTAALVAPTAASSGGATRAAHGAALFNVTLAVCASFGWTYPHGPGHPKYDAAVALGGVGHVSADVGGVKVATVSAAAAVAPEAVDGGDDDDDDELLVAAAERFFGEGGPGKLDESVDNSASGIVAAAVASESVVGESVDASAIAGANASDDVPGLASAVPATASMAEPAAISNPAPPQAQKRTLSHVVRFGRGGQRFFAPAPSAVSVALTRNVGAAHLHVGVEELSLHHYAEKGQGGGWAGSHCEGSIVTSIAALLLWPVIFAGSVPDTFITPYQDGPLDWDTPEHFYRGRLPALRARLEWIAAASGDALVAELGALWRAHYSRACRGMRWEAAPLQLLQLVAVGLGGGSLAAICDAVAWNRKQLSGGMPDLLLWRVLAPSDALELPPQLLLPTAVVAVAAVAGPPAVAVESAQPAEGAQQPEGEPEPEGPAPMPSDHPRRSKAALAAADWPDLRLPPRACVSVRLVEVKGPRDRLSEKQHVWLRILLAAGAGAAVCKVSEPQDAAKGAAGGGRSRGGKRRVTA